MYITFVDKFVNVFFISVCTSAKPLQMFKKTHIAEG